MQPFPLLLLLVLSNFFWIPLWIAGVNAWECESYTTPCVWDKAVRSFLHSMYLRLLPKPCMLLSIVSSNKTMSRPKIACTWDYWVIDYPTLAIIAVWRPANGFEVGRRWTPFCNKWAPCSTPTNSSKWMIPSNSPSRTCAHLRWVLVANAKLKPGHSTLTSFKKKKLSVLIIKNGDKLCCTRAIVAAKARLDQHPNWDGFKRGRRIQAEHAVDLHHKMRVPRGLCGHDELRAFSLAPSF